MEFVATMRSYLLSCKVDHFVVLHKNNLIESFGSLHSDIYLVLSVLAFS